MLVAALAACVQEPIPGMELRCQTTECVCEPVESVFPVTAGSRSVDVLWRENGDAYCPEGYVLREAPEE